MNTPRSLFDLCLYQVQYTATEEDWMWMWESMTKKTYWQNLLPQHALQHLAIQANKKYQKRYELIIKELLELDCQLQNSLYFKIIKPPSYDPAKFAQQFQDRLCVLVENFYLDTNSKVFPFKVSNFQKLVTYGDFIGQKLRGMNQMVQTYKPKLNVCPYLHSEPSCTYCCDHKVKDEWRPKDKNKTVLKCKLEYSRNRIYTCIYHPQPAPEPRRRPFYNDESDEENLLDDPETLRQLTQF